MAFVNLTPHTINLKSVLGEEITIPASGQVARVQTSFGQDQSIMGFPITHTRLEGVVGLPDPVEGFTFIVSGMVAQHPSMKDRPDVVAPDTINAIRDNLGNIMAVRGFLRYS